MSRLPLRRRLAVTAATVAGIAALAAVTAGSPAGVLAASPTFVPDASTLPVEAANKLAPVQGFPGSDALEAQTAAEQYAQARGLVPPQAYRDAFQSMQDLPVAPGAWKEPTRVPYDSDDLRYRDPNGNSTGGSGIVSGRVVALAADPADATGATLYAGAANGGVFRSTDKGTTWTPITDNLPSLSTGDIAVNRSVAKADTDKGDGSVWLAMGEANTGGTSYAGDGVWRLPAGADTTRADAWQQVGGGSISGTTINKLQFDGAGFVYAATDRGLFKHASTSTAGDWTPVLTPNKAALAGDQTSNAVYANIINDVITKPGDPSTVLVAAGWRSSTDPDYYGNGFWLSTRGGAADSFTKVNPTGAINPKEIGNTTLAYSRDGSKLYAVVQSTVLINQGTGTKAANTVLAGVYRSDSGSLTGPWSQIADSSKLANSGSALKQTLGGKGYGPGVQAWYNQFLAVDPTNPQHVYLGLEEVYETYDGGSSWSAVGPYWNFYFPCWSVDPAKNTCPSTTHSDQHDVVFAGDRVYVSNDGGVYSRPANGGTVNANGNATDWTSLNSTLRSLQYYAAGAGKDTTLGGVVLSGGLQDNGGSILRGVQPDGSSTDPGDGASFPYEPKRTGLSTAGPTGKMGSNFGGDGGDVIVNPANGCDIVQEYVYLSLRKTLNSGCGVSDGTVASTADIAPLDPAPRFIAPIEADAVTPSTWFAGGNSVWVNTKGFGITKGSDWVEAYRLGLDPKGLYESTTALGSSNGVAYAGWCSQCNNKGFTRGLARVQKAADGTWTGTQVAATGLPNRYLSGVHVDPANGKHVVVAVNGFNRRFTEGPGSADPKGHLFESVDGGQSFTSVDGNLPDVPADDVILSNDGLTALVSTDLGVVRGTRTSPKGAFSFSRLGTGLPAATVMDLSFGPDGVLYAATHSRGIFSLNTGFAGFPVPTATAAKGK
ncbi:MAG: glycosyl hydrolase [Frankiales bacterium]|nr:glycosyl hydrolase [Frankiales bacterium]